MLVYRSSFINLPASSKSPRDNLWTSTTKTARYVRKNPVEAIIGTEDNSMINLYGGELKRDNFNILLSHYPDRVMEYSKIDLGLGAHSHGLQVNLPFCRFHHKEKYTRGLHKMGVDKYLYVNRGLGYSLLKIRFLSTREIVKIELRGGVDNGNS